MNLGRLPFSGAVMPSVLTTPVVSEMLELDIRWGISETKTDAPLLQNHSGSKLKFVNFKAHCI